MGTKWFSGAPFGVQSHRWGLPPEERLESGGGGRDGRGPGSEERGPVFPGHTGCPSGPGARSPSLSALKAFGEHLLWALRRNAGSPARVGGCCHSAQEKWAGFQCRGSSYPPHLRHLRVSPTLCGAQF